MNLSGATDAERIDDLIEQLGEMADNLSAVMTENAMLTKIVTADAGLAGAVAQIKQLNREIEALRERNNGLLEEKNAAIRAAKLAQKAVKK